MSDSEEKKTCCCPCGMKIADFYHGDTAGGGGVGIDGETGIFFNRLAPHPHFHKYHSMRPFRAWVQMVLPQVYDDALSYQELIYKLLAYINTMIANMDVFKNNISALEDAFARLECWINQWFKNLNIEGELEQVLDKMSLDGRLFDALSKYLAIGSGLQRSTTKKTKSTTETTTQTASDYPHCCCNCDCCERCYYKEIKDGETVTITRDIDNVHVVITIARNGDEFTTTRVVTWEYEESILYTWLEEGRGITINPESNPENSSQTIGVNIDDNSNWGVKVYDNDDGSIYFKLNFSVGDGMEISDAGNGVAKFSVLIKGGTGIDVTVDKDNYYVISVNSGDLDFVSDIKASDGIEVGADGDSTYVKSLIKAGSGISVELDDDNYYKISTLSSSLSDTLVIGTDYEVEVAGNLYPVGGSSQSAFKDYEHYTSVVEEDVNFPAFTGEIQKDSSGNVVALTTSIAGRSYICGGNIADNNIFILRHNNNAVDYPCRLIDFVFKGDYAPLSDLNNTVTITHPSANVWNVQAINGGDTMLTESNVNSLAAFGGSWIVTCTIQNYEGNDGYRHFVLCADSIADGYNRQYSRMGDYIYGVWLNVSRCYITLD